MQKRFYSIKEIAEYLAVSKSGIRKWVRTGQIPFLKINGCIRFDIEAIDKWLSKSQYKVI